jgi:peptidase A4-like protein
MRRSWPVLFATGILTCGGLLAGASPAAAAGSTAGPSAGLFSGPGAAVRPGGTMALPGGSAAGMAALPPAGAAGVRATTVVSSTNWSGYAATGAAGQFTSVSSSWVQPSAACSSGDQYSAFWVGLDGYSSTTVEQTGSEVDCAGRTAEYSAWYEMYPAYPVYFNNKVKAGDNFTGSVTYTGGNFVIKLADTTQKWTHTVTEALAGAMRSSAEVIAEAPSAGNGGVLPLTNFGTMTFSSAKVNTTTNLCSASGLTEITMPSDSVSSLGCPGTFSVSYTGGGGSQWPWW